MTCKLATSRTGRALLRVRSVQAQRSCIVTSSESMSYVRSGGARYLLSWQLIRIRACRHEMEASNVGCQSPPAVLNFVTNVVKRHTPTRDGEREHAAARPRHTREADSQTDTRRATDSRAEKTQSDSNAYQFNMPVKSCSSRLAQGQATPQLIDMDDRTCHRQATPGPKASSSCAIAHSSTHCTERDPGAAAAPTGSPDVTWHRAHRADPHPTSAAPKASIDASKHHVDKCDSYDACFRRYLL